jgi:hypothetical protein
MIAIDFLSLLSALSFSICESPGIYCRSDSLRTCSSAYVEWEAAFSEYQLMLYGSFVAKSTTGHTFRIYSDSTSSLSDDPSANFVFDTDSRGNQEGTWDYPISLFKDWRYYNLTQTNSKHYYSELRLSVQFSPGASFSTLIQSNSDLCTASGCKDLNFDRGYSCLPSSSPSRTPIATASQPFPPSSVCLSQPFPPSSACPSQPFPPSSPLKHSLHFGFGVDGFGLPRKTRPRIAPFAAALPRPHAVSFWIANSTLKKV